MNLLNFFTSIYGHLHNYKGVPYWVLSPFRRLVRGVANWTLPRFLSHHQNERPNKENGVIVSLTSFPERIDKVWLVVECFFRQTVKPQIIILWLSKEQFPNIECIPLSLRRLENEFFVIKIVDGDIRSHKKYLYVSKESPDSLVLLVDDDLYYPSDMIEKMMIERNQTGNVVSMYSSTIKYDNNGIICPYSTWEDEYGTSYSKDLFFGSGGGLLFQPAELFKDLTNIDLALQLCPTADDIWLNAMVRLSARRISKIKSGLLLPIEQKGNINRLANDNVEGGRNDYQLRAVNEYYEKLLNTKVF